MHHDFAGEVMVELEPDENKDLGDDDKWGKTMLFRRVFGTLEAVKIAQDQQDNGIYIGELAMPEVLRKEKEKEIAPTVH
jgi:hypothetical protein